MESKAAKKAQICVEWVCTMLCTSLALVQMKTSNSEHMGMKDYALCDNRAQGKPITAIEVVGMMYTEPEVGKQYGPGLGEDSARDVEKLSRKMMIMRKQDKPVWY